MSKRTCRLVIDTTYLLPFFGIEVEGLSENDVIALSQRCELIYPSMLLPELWAKVLREAKKAGLNRPPEEAVSAMNALLYVSGIKLAPPTPEQMGTAALLRLAGHKDIFDCLGFGCAESLSIDFLSEDEELRRLVSDLRKDYRFKSRVLSLKDVIL